MAYVRAVTSVTTRTYRLRGSEAVHNQSVLRVERAALTVCPRCGESAALPHPGLGYTQEEWPGEALLNPHQPKDEEKEVPKRRNEAAF